jgi:hypothetical protein
MPAEMKKQKILKIDPDFGCKTAGIRTPGARSLAQIIQN